jgi:GNAT superfamily N-acetyltransferase
MISVTPADKPGKALYSSDDLTMHSLLNLGINSSEAALVQQWILSMTLATDGEEGTEFWQWIVLNNQQAGPASICDTFLFVENASQTIVATASIVTDDRMVGTRHGIDGVWLGGFNVRAQFRRHGIGAQVLQLLEEHVQAWARDHNQDIRVNLFTDNPIAMNMYNRARYLRLGVFAVDNSRMATFYSKTFSANTREKDQVLSFIDWLNTRALTYHNHKEASAWAGLAFYYLLMFGWIAPLGLREPLFNSWSLRLMAVVLVFVVTWLVKLYIDDQFKLRSTFGDYTAACYRLSARCIDMSERDVNKLNFSIPALPTTPNTGHRDLAFPSFVKDEVSKLANVPHQERRTLESAQRTLLWGGAAVVALVLFFGRSFADAPPAAPDIAGATALITNQLTKLTGELNQINQTASAAATELSKIGGVSADITDLQSRVTELEHHAPPAGQSQQTHTRHHGRTVQ